MSIFLKLNQFLNDLLKVSKLTKVKNKKRTILFLVFIINFLIFSDILIILFFSKFFGQEINNSNAIIKYFLSYEYLLPVFIVTRFYLLYLEKIITTKLQINIEKNLRINMLSDVFIRGNISVADAYYHVNILSSQVGSFYSTLATLFGSILQITIFTTYLIFTNSKVVFIFGIGIFFLFFPTIFLTKLGRKFAHKAYLSGQEISKKIERVLDNLFLIKILKKENSEIKEYNFSLLNYYSARMNDIRAGTISSLLPNFITLFLLSILIIFFKFKDLLTFDFIGILLRLFQSLGLFNKNIHTVSSFHVYLERLYQSEKNKSLILKENYKFEKVSSKKTIQFVDVSFKYSSSDFEIFNNLNFKINENTHTVITGENGSGKSTLLGLATGIFYPTAGAVITNFDKIGYISASPMIINGTLRQNILYGCDNQISDHEILKIIDEFSLFNEKIVNPLDLIVNNKNLSTGQMQKVSFIRSLMSGSDLLILDESTANLDSKTRKFIFDILGKRNLTILNSTHNPEDFKHADYHIKILVENGKRLIKKDY